MTGQLYSQSSCENATPYSKEYINWLRVKKTKPFWKGNQYKTNLSHVKSTRGIKGVDRARSNSILHVFMQESVEEVKTSVNRRVDYVLQTLKSYHIKDFTIHKSLQRVEKLYQMEVEVVVEFSDFSKCEQVCNLLVEKLDETVKVSHPFLYHTPSKLDSLRYGWFRQYRQGSILI